MPLSPSAKPQVEIPPPPPGFDPEKLFGGVYWYQKWQVFQGVFTPGTSNSVEDLFGKLGVPADLTGKRVLDVGAWNGLTSLECERRGAREVIALGPDDPARTGFNRIRDAVGATRARYLLGTVYDLDPEKLGYFDVVLFFGVLYHLRYPLLGIDNIRRVCTGSVYVETFVTDNAWVSEGPEGARTVPMQAVSPQLLPAPVWQFYRAHELANDPSNWFGPNTTAVLQAFRSAGFGIRLVEVWKERACFHAEVRPGYPEFLLLSPFDSAYYDVLLRPVLGRQKFGMPDPGERFLAAHLACDEYFQKTGGTEEAWVAGLYGKLLERSPKPDELRDGLERLRRGPAPRRQAVVTALLTGPEYLKRVVVRCYERFLKRTPPAAELDQWVGCLHRFLTADQVVQAFVCGPEYFILSGNTNARWLDCAYQELLGRRRDAASDAVLKELDRGEVSRACVVSNLLASPDYRRRLLRAVVDAGQAAA